MLCERTRPRWPLPFIRQALLCLVLLISSGPALAGHLESIDSLQISSLSPQWSCTTSTRYDSHGRPYRTLLPATDEHPATETLTSYDLLGRRLVTTDQEGKVTRSRYDGLSRLLEVRQYIDQALAATDPTFNLPATTLNVVSTTFSYDETGSQTTQIDALGRVTTYWTDAMGRRVKRILPDLATEHLDYDPWGRLWHRKDFAGKTTTYGYDVLDRLKTKTADTTHLSLAYTHAIARVEYDYDVNGAREAARTYNASSTLLYTETTPSDERGRLDYKDTGSTRLDYGYYANGLLQDTVSSNAVGVNLGYRYDEANRLAYVDDASNGLPLRTTGYTYNANGSLETHSAPNGVVHTYGYDALNRLRTLSLTHTLSNLRGYDYQLKAAGHRRKIVESTGRTLDYVYDGVNRLTNETSAGGPVGTNGTVGYTLDKVGNRQARASTVANLEAQSAGFNTRDQLDSDSYDPNGNTTVSLGITNLPDVYDFEDRLIVRHKPDGGTINLSYDADGIRIQKTILSVASNLVSATYYLIDSNTLTGYAQVVEETKTAASGTATIVYAYGSDLISQSVLAPGATAPELGYYGYDGLGSVRQLTNASGVVTDTWDYDAFGNVISRNGTTENAYLYRGEQFDADLGMYSLRARFYNQSTGRFWNQDTYEGSNSDPASLHKYLYGSSNPVSFSDPSGHFSLAEVQTSQNVDANLNRMAAPNAARIAQKASRSKIAQLYIGIGRGFTSRTFGHAFVFMEFLGSPEGLYYDANPSDAGTEILTDLLGAGKYLDFGRTEVGGIVQERAFSKAAAARKGKLIKVPGASLSAGQFLVWRFSARGLIADVNYKFLSFPGGGAVSCYSWTAEAAVIAWGVARIPF